jgi:hypothetical protein
VEGAEGEEQLMDEGVREYASDDREGFREKVLRHLDEIQTNQGAAMADITKLTEEVNGLGTVVEATVTELGELKSKASEVEELKKKIAELEASGGTGTPTQAEVDVETTKVQEDKAKLEAAKA